MRNHACLLTIVLSLLLGGAAAATPLLPNDILVTGTGAVGQGLIRIDRETGAQTLISAGSYGDFQLVGNTVYALGGSGVVTIDTQTGIASPFSSGALIDNPVGLAVGNDGDVYVMNSDTLDGGASIVQIDGSTRQQTFLTSDLGILFGSDLEIGSNGNLIALALRAAFGSAVLEVGVASGDRSTLIDYNEIRDQFGGAQWGVYATGLGVSPTGLIVSSDGLSNTSGIAAYDPSTQEAFRIGSTVMGVADGFVIELLSTDVAIDALGTRWIVGDAAGRRVDGLFRAWRLEGDGTPFSSGSFNEIQIVPIPEPSTALLLSLGLTGLACRGRRTGIETDSIPQKTMDCSRR